MFTTFLLMSSSMSFVIACSLVDQWCFTEGQVAGGDSIKANGLIPHCEAVER